MTTVFFSPKMINVRKKREVLYTQLMDAVMKNCDDGEIFDETHKKPGEQVILDMDGLLLDCIPMIYPENIEYGLKEKPVPRPGLRKFLRYVFHCYDRVSIWTAALPKWYNICKEEVLIPNMPVGAKFHFVRTRSPDEVYSATKPLIVIIENYPDEYSLDTTTIIDDNEATFQENIDNAVHVPHFFYDLLGDTPIERRENAAKDVELFTLIERLKVRKPGNTGASILTEKLV